MARDNAWAGPQKLSLPGGPKEEGKRHGTYTQKPGGKNHQGIQRGRKRSDVAGASAAGHGKAEMKLRHRQSMNELLEWVFSYRHRKTAVWF